MLFPAKIAAFEIEDQSVRLAVLRVGRGLPQVIELHAAPVTYETDDQRFDAMVAAVNQVLEALRAAPAAFVLCAPGRYSIVRMLSVPFRGRARVAAAVPIELEPYLAIPLEDLLIDYAPVTERSGETDVLAVGLRRALLEEQLAVLQAAGIEVESASLDVAGLAALWSAIHRPGKGLHAVLHVRRSGSVLVVHYGKSLVFFRHLPFDANQVRHTPAPVAREILNSLRGFMAKWQSEGAVEALHVTGIDLEPAEAEALGAELRLPVQSEQMLLGLRGAKAALPAEERNTPPGENTWEAALGTAIGASSGLSAFNFREEQQDWRAGLRGVIAHVLVSACLLAIVLVGWAVYYVINTAQNEATLAGLRAQIETVTAEVDSLAAQGIKVDISLFSGPSLLDVLRNLTSSIQASGVRVESVQVNRPEARGGWIVVQGTADNVPAINQAFNALKAQTMFQLNDDPVISTEGDKMRFTIVAQRPEPVVEEPTP